MKNIWKLLMIAMMAIAMVGCPTETKDDDSSATTTTVAPIIIVPDEEADGVHFFIHGKLESISTEWGGNENTPSMSLMLLNDTGIAALAGGTITDPKQMPVGAPMAQVQAYGNAAVATSVKGTWGMFGQNTFDYYDCFAFVTDPDVGEYILYVDMSKIKVEYLKLLGKDYATTNGEKTLTADDTFDIEGLTPCVLALQKKEEAGEDYLAAIWSGSLVQMKGCSSFPAEADIEKPTYTPNSPKVLNIIYGDLPGCSWDPSRTPNLTGTEAERKYEFKVEAVPTAAYNFKICKAVDAITAQWAYQAGKDATVALGEAYTLEIKDNAPNMKFLPTEAGDYVLVIYSDADKASVKIVKKADYVPGQTPTTDPVNAATPTFTTNLDTETVTYSIASSDEAPVLTVVAAVTDDGTLSYQWQKKAEGDENFADIDGATVASYTPVVTAAGTTQYKVIVTNTNNDATGEKTAIATSAIATVTVTE